MSFLKACLLSEQFNIVDQVLRSVVFGTGKWFAFSCAPLVMKEHAVLAWVKKSFVRIIEMRTGAAVKAYDRCAIRIAPVFPVDLMAMANI